MIVKMNSFFSAPLPCIPSFAPLDASRVGCGVSVCHWDQCFFCHCECSSRLETFGVGNSIDCLCRGTERDFVKVVLFACARVEGVAEVEVSPSGVGFGHSDDVGA
jgi:hypothetical protein